MGDCKSQEGVFMSEENFQEIVRIPVTLEILVEKIKSGCDVDYHQNLLYEHAIKLFIAALHKPQNIRYIKHRKHEEIIELAHDAYCLFLEQLKDYDANRSKITTWIYTLVGIYVGRIKRKIMKDQRVNNVEKFDQVFSGTLSVSSNRMISDIDFKYGINLLYEKYPEDKEIIVRIFGNPEEGITSPNLKYTEIMEETGYDYYRIRGFFEKKAKPLLKKYFR